MMISAEDIYTGIFFFLFFIKKKHFVISVLRIGTFFSPNLSLKLFSYFDQNAYFYLQPSVDQADLGHLLVVWGLS